MIREFCTCLLSAFGLYNPYNHNEARQSMLGRAINAQPAQYPIYAAGPDQPESLRTINTGLRLEVSSVLDVFLEFKVHHPNCILHIKTDLLKSKYPNIKFYQIDNDEYSQLILDLMAAQIELGMELHTVSPRVTVDFQFIRDESVMTLSDFVSHAIKKVLPAIQAGLNATESSSIVSQLRELKREHLPPTLFACAEFIHKHITDLNMPGYRMPRARITRANPEINIMFFTENFTGKYEGPTTYADISDGILGPEAPYPDSYFDREDEDFGCFIDYSDRQLK